MSRFRFASLATVLTLITLPMNSAEADHRHGIRGGSRSGFQLYIGPGIGSGYGGGYGIGRGNYGYGSGLRYGSGSGYYGGNSQPRFYSQPSYQVQPSYQPNYVTPSPSYQYVDPNAGQYIQSQPSIPAAPQYDGLPIVITNPPVNDNPIEYSLNGNLFTIKPGQSQTFAHDRKWIIEFDRGKGFGGAQYSLKSVTYKFKPTAKGWELFEQADQGRKPSDLPAPPSDDLQLTTPSDAQINSPQPAKPSEAKKEPEEQVVQPRKLPKPPASSPDVTEKPTDGPKLP